MQPTGSKPTSYIPALDGIRAIAFLLVFCAHGLPAVSYYIPATLGVTIFFFLSGYLITTLLRKELLATGTVSLRDFYIRRTLRIFVPLYLIYALAALGSVLLHRSPGNLFGFASVYLYFHNYTIASRAWAFVPLGMEVVWSLAIEEHFYLLFPLAYLALSRSRLTRTTQTRILIAFCLLELLWRIVLVTVIKPIGPWTYLATDARLDSILWGCILALTQNPVFFGKPRCADRPLLPERLQLPAFLAALLFLGTTLAIRNPFYRDTLRYTLQALALYVLFGFVIQHSRHPLVRWLESPPLRYLGWTSYVLYLSHGFFLYAVDILLPHHPRLLTVLGLALSLAFATLLRYTVELPLQRLRARFRHVPAPDPTAPNGLIA